MNIIELAKKANIDCITDKSGQVTYMEFSCDLGGLEAFADLVEAQERDRITKMLNYLHMKAQPYHNYYKHAAVEINRKEGEGEKI